MFHKNRNINFLLHIILLILLIIVFLTFIKALTVYREYSKYSNMTTLNFYDDINLIEYNDENYNNKNIEIYETDIVGNFDTEYVTPNELGEIMIIMYHGVDENIDDTNIYHRSVMGFKSDLNRIYNDKYYIISLKDYINNEINVPLGYTPIVITFDDGLSSAFSLTYNEENELVPKKDTALYILNEYREKYNRPNATATFFINTKNPPFYGFGKDIDRINYLIDNGYDIGNHSHQHPLMKNMSKEDIQKEIALTESYIKNIRPDYHMIAFAYPYGGVPHIDNIPYVLEGEYEGTNYKYNVSLLASPTNNTTNIYNIDFNPYFVPRIRGTNTSDFDLGWYFDYYERKPEYRFISDGDKDTVTLLRGSEVKLNEKMIENKNLIILD